jgi:hypothetical protein
VSSPMGLDARLPIGGLFTVLGVLLTGYGLLTAADAGFYDRSLSVNVNLWWGLVMLLFGATMLSFGLRARSRPGK